MGAPMLFGSIRFRSAVARRFASISGVRDTRADRWPGLPLDASGDPGLPALPAGVDTMLGLELPDDRLRRLPAVDAIAARRLT